MTPPPPDPATPDDPAFSPGPASELAVSALRPEVAPVLDGPSGRFAVPPEIEIRRAFARDAEETLPRWMLRIVPKRLFEAPITISLEDTKIFSIRVAVTLMAGLLHLFLAPLFAVVGRPVMALIQLVSAALYGVAIAMGRRGLMKSSLFFAFAVASSNMYGATIVFGIEPGFLLYNFVQAGMPFMIRRSSASLTRVVLVAYVLVSGAIVLLVSWRLGPIVPLEPWKVRALFAFNVSGTLTALIWMMYWFSSVTERGEARLEREHQRAEQLLLNILPAPIAARLKRDPRTIADSFDTATVLFADIVGFTGLASRLPSAQVVAFLNDLFSGFDRLAEKHGLEKIKTIGDAYMAVGGVPTPGRGPRETTAGVAEMAIDMIAFVKDYAARTGRPLDIRVGLHTGPLVAGVIGMKKFAYDLWGETVNTASRMESHGAPGRIQVSEATRAILDDRYDFESRGAVSVKGMGEVRTFFLVKRRAGARGRGGGP